MESEPGRPDRPERRPYAAGDYLTRYPAASSHHLRIDSPRPKAGWKERQPGDAIRVEHPGSTVRFEDAHWEVVRMEVIRSSPPRFYYYLAPWDDRFPIRQLFRYDRDECEAARRRAIEEEEEERQRLTLVLLSPLTGALPASDQLRMEAEHGVLAGRATLLSAIVFFILSLAIPPQSGSLGAVVLGWYVAIESIARLYYAGKGGGVVGSAVVVVPLGLYRAWRRWREVRPARASTAEILAASDETTYVSDAGHTLEVLSLLPKPHWNTRAAIRYREVEYTLVDRCEVELDGVEHHRFRLAPWPSHRIANSVVDYDPAEVRALHIAERKVAGGVWIDSLFALWGLLDGVAQRRLERLYGHDARAATRLAILGSALLGLVGAGSALHHLAGEAPRLLDALMLALGISLLTDAIRRGLALRRGRIVGSLFRPLVAPLSRRLL